ncbi:MAG: hypothetical protein HYV07_18805 [Deltaproteobacteria bacterium]|nr:hypothetical protein [Deltaproteobacteria bacterium]
MTAPAKSDLGSLRPCSAKIAKTSFAPSSSGTLEARVEAGDQPSHLPAKASRCRAESRSAAEGHRFYLDFCAAGARRLGHLHHEETAASRYL